MQLFALLRLGFPTAPGLLSLNLATYSNSQAHSTKGTPSPLRALTACGSTVSGSISLPSRGAFHLSLTVLYAIGSYLVFSLGRWSSQIPARFLVSRRTQVSHHADICFSITGLSPTLVALSSGVLLNKCFLTTRSLLRNSRVTLQPHDRNDASLTLTMV